MAYGKGKPRGRKPRREKPEFDQQIVDLARVTRVTKGGKQMSFRVCLVIGDRKGRVGYGIAKGKDVQIAVGKALNQAKKGLIRVPFIDETIPHRVESKFKSGRVMIKPAPKGSGIIAGSAIRTVLELAGVPNASAKKIGRTTNKMTNVKATFDALQSFLPSAVKKAKAAAPAPKKPSADAQGKKETRNKSQDTKKKKATKAPKADAQGKDDAK